MAIRENEKGNIWCNECGKEFYTMASAQWHLEQSCIVWGKGSPVIFPLDYRDHEGEILEFGIPVESPGQLRGVYVRGTEQLYEPDPLNGLEGDVAYVLLSQLKDNPQSSS